ncbi:MAG: Histone deacetylase domain protein [Methanosaeta sp. PtaB.Bin039]|nr:MAG: Histone deacetylase domain protein [Methanosaeta sp. PtaB.Bin039]HOT06825.1 histone deacetylase family protein [Methanotrichaceae archaeon]HQF16721.1 histone deacetylase family protein [Methanotrichaceae archaeon]HQI91353.1 histone deacetylase family protein [Methanotrichaceae archaeon]HQJ28681.1 histone deacetylase family protein [Methanotrichaceae archaeon]
MKIVYSDAFAAKYLSNPVESPSRVADASQLLRQRYPFLEPTAAQPSDISAVHETAHIQRVMDRGMYEPAALAAGGAIASMELALKGEPAFALVRPPGHHASAGHAWGMCFLNSIAIAVKRALPRAGRVMILDMDLHFGDGTASIFRWTPQVRVVNPGAVDPNFDYIGLDAGAYIEQVKSSIEEASYDLLAISAGFDTYVEDWGGLLTLSDFRELGRITKEAAQKSCDGRRFAVLEGGYHPDLKYCIASFLDGFS